jgi:cell fate regulator YaaT (PSP1 superfamily)
MNQQTDEGPAAQVTADTAQDEPACPTQSGSPTNQPADSLSEPDSSLDADPQVVIGIRIREASRIYHFSAPKDRVFAGDYVVVDRARGDQLARVVTVPDPDEPSKAMPRDVRPIVRLADANDRERAEHQTRRADEILQDMRTAAVRQDMGLYPVAVELNLDGDQGTAWFQAPDHVDFRPLVSEVQDKHDVRLNMQQANQRERAQLVDGYDICGLRLCCSSWMTEFPHVGIRVAKDQDLSLNPDSISGVCGRLLCCLTFEHEVYREMRGTLPKVGKNVSTPAGMGRVIKLNVLQQYVTISLDDHHQRVDVPVAEIGMAVRTEDSPNQAIADAERERERSERMRIAAAPSEAEQAIVIEKPEISEDAAPIEPVPERPARRRRRRRAVNVDSAPSASSAPRPRTEQPSAGGPGAPQPPPRRRRNRRRRPRGPEGQSGGSSG